MITPTPNNEVLYRRARADDVRFVFDSWLRSWRTCPAAGTIRNDMYFPVQRATIEGLIGRGAELEIACLEADVDKILGWSCFEVAPSGESIINYVYVKDAYLPFGLGKALVDRAPGKKPGFYTHRYRQVLDACGDGWRHAPEIARRK